MFTCFVCTSKEVFSNAEAFIAHVQIFHSSLQVSGTLKCTFKDCSLIQRQFNIFKSFRKHVRTHKSCNIVPSNVNTSTFSHEPENFENYDQESNLQSETSEPEIIPSLSVSFEESLGNSVVALIATMYDIGLTETQVQVMVDSHRQLLGGPFLSVLKNKVLDICQNSKFNVPESDTKNICNMFDSFAYMFDGFETTYLRLKEFESCGSYIPPEPFVIGQSLLEKYVNGNVVMEPTTLTGQFIPMRKVLKGFLELPGVLSTILQYMEKVESDTFGRIQNIVQGSLWKDKIKPKFVGKVVLSVVFKFDDYEPNKSLGSHAGVYNLGAGYIRLPSLPPQFQGSLENIFLTVLFHTCDKFCGNEKLFRKVLTELKFLEEEGIYVVCPEGTFHVFFALCVAGGDNKGANEILGFASFSANFYCRICSMHKKAAAKAVCSDATLLRTRDSYDRELEIGYLTLTGRKGVCIFNELRSYHVYENAHLDVTHDLDEGCWKYLMTDLVKYFLDKGRFSLNYLNERIQCFYYGPNEERNRPPLIESEHIKKDGTLKGSASDMRCLLRYFGLMIGHLVLQSDQAVWNVYQKARSIVDIVTAPSFTKNDLGLLKCLIEEHNSGYLKEFNKDLKPKFHMCTHIPEIMKSLGPLEPLSCIRIEARHKQGVEVARKSNNRINLPKTVATRYQVDLSFRLLSCRGLVEDFNFSRVQLSSIFCIPDYLLFVNVVPPEIHDKTLSIVKWVQTNGTKYQERTGCPHCC